MSDEKFIQDLREFHERTEGDGTFSALFNFARIRAKADGQDIIDAIKAELRLRQNH